MFWETAEISFPRGSLQVQFVYMSHVQICLYMKESLEIFKNVSVCTLKYIFGPKVLQLKTRIN